MKLRPITATAFTLIEMLVVMAVIAILASIILSVNGYAQKKSAMIRAEGEIAAMSAACASYQGDFGSYPQDSSGDTDALCPYLHGDPSVSEYQKGSIALYKALSGDAKPGSDPEPPAGPNDKPDGRSETKAYFEFRPAQLQKNAAGEVQYIKDPWGNAYGYSTNASTAEATFRRKLEKNPNTIRPTVGKGSAGYNPTYDLWSTGGVLSKNTAEALEPDRKRWVKNW